MEFSDYKDNPNDLIGKKVLINTNYGSLLDEIINVTKTAFKTKNYTGLFSLINGGLKTSDKWNTTSCKLISEEKAIELSAKWKRDREIKKLRAKMEVKIKTMTFEELKQMEKI